eukprot:TRINITY_DN40814_c0_g1_i1.p3 TRINITY_DN40814_c0_g1~~TRINITY_DN40814_c0_g1_i1.p3  ORF type:complete len:267 (-),score=82.89 TRINITY_DN40814_c0_g1_i1:3-803(-)
MSQEQLRTKIINTSSMRKGVFDLIPDKAARILDVGCGRGGLLLRLQRDKKCTELFGVDMDVEAIGELRQFVDYAEVVDIEREELLPEKYKGYFNVIIMHDFVEHLFDPWLTLTRVREYLADGGTAIISTPNILYWRLQYEILNGRFPYGHGLWHSGHLRWYTPASLLTVLTIGGWTVQQYLLEILGKAPMKLLDTTDPLDTVQFPPVELQPQFPDVEPVTTAYARNIRPAYPAFFAHKIIAVCTKGPLIWKPKPLTYDVPLPCTLR